MNPEWLCYVDGQEYGPYTWPQLVQMAAAGNIVPASYVRRNHDSQWYAADQVPGLFGPAAPVSPKQALHPATAPRSASASGVSSSGPMKKVSASGAVAAARPATKPAPAYDTSPAAASQTAALTPPAGMPSQPPTEIPRGRVAAKPTAPQPVAMSPVPATQAGAKPGWIPVVKDTAREIAPAVGAGPLQFPRGEEKSTAAVPGKKPDKSKTLVLALGGAIAGVALLGVLAVVWKMNQTPEKPKEVAAAAVEIPTTEIDPAGIVEEANPSGAVAPPTPAATPKAGTTPVVAKGTEKPAVATPDTSAALMSTVKTWNPIERFGKFGVSKGLMCTKMDAWLAADAGGKRVQVTYQAGGSTGGEVQASVAPAESAPGETPAIAAPAGGEGGRFVTSEPATYLFIQVSISNTDVKPRPYAGWNVGETAAVLADPAGKPHALVATSATPGVKRVAAKEIVPGETIVDTLVFAVPPGSDMHYRLALPKPAFSTRQTGAWGYEVTGAGLATLAANAQGGTGGNVANQAPGPAPVKPMVAIPIPGVQEEPKPAPAPAEPEVKKPAFNPNGPIPIPGLTDVPPDNSKPAGPKKPEEVPNLNPPPVKKK